MIIPPKHETSHEIWSELCDSTFLHPNSSNGVMSNVSILLPGQNR